jgi:hypothetical protein
MNRRHLWILGAGLSLAAAGSLPAQAQYGHTLSSLVNRPTTNSPSQVLGGTYTRAATRPLESTRGNNVSMFGQRPLPTRAGMRDYTRNRSLGLTDVGTQTNLADFSAGSYFDVLSRAMRDRSGDISAISGLNQAMSINLPLPGQDIGGVPSLGACAYTPRPATNRFQDLLGLQPPAPEGPCQMAPSVAERLDARSSELAARATADGAAFFKAGTEELPDQAGNYQKCPDCPSKLGQAVQVLRMANDLDEQSGLPSLLIAHAALEQNRPLVASSALLDALRRDPHLFTGSGQALDRYFGDVEQEGGRSALLTAQMRRYARLGEKNPTSPPAFALQAYCAWRLGDMVSARDSLDRLDELIPSVDESEAADLHGLASALRRALP